MGITTNNFFEYIFNVIFSPKSFFEKEDIKISLRLALATVMLIAFIGKISTGIFTGNIKEPLFALSLIWTIICTVLIWFLTALFFEYIAKIFNQGGNLSRLLFLTAFAPLPYMFYAPLNLLKDANTFGYFIAVLLEITIYFWVISLYALSLKATYKITLSRAFMLIFLPFIGSYFALYWLIGFITKIWYIFSL